MGGFESLTPSQSCEHWRPTEDGSASVFYLTSVTHIQSLCFITVESYRRTCSNSDRAALRGCFKTRFAGDCTHLECSPTARTRAWSTCGESPVDCARKGCQTAKGR